MRTSTDQGHFKWRHNCVDNFQEQYSMIPRTHNARGRVLLMLDLDKLAKPSYQMVLERALGIRNPELGIGKCPTAQCSVS